MAAPNILPESAQLAERLTPPPKPTFQLLVSPAASPEAVSFSSEAAVLLGAIQACRFHAEFTRNRAVRHSLRLPHGSVWRHPWSYVSHELERARLDEQQRTAKEALDAARTALLVAASGPGDYRPEPWVAGGAQAAHPREHPFQTATKEGAKYLFRPVMNKIVKQVSAPSKRLRQI